MSAIYALTSKYQDDILDHELKHKYRELNIWADSGSMKKLDPDDERQNPTSYKLLKAEGMLRDALKGKCSYSEVLIVVDEFLKMEPKNVEALTIRAIANSQLYNLTEAVHDAEAAISIEPGDDSRLGRWMRSQLPAWQQFAQRIPRNRHPPIPDQFPRNDKCNGDLRPDTTAVVGRFC
jgi:hypothetical protein